MKEDREERTQMTETQTNERGDHFHGHHLPWEMDIVADSDGYTILVWANDAGEVPHFHVIRGEDRLKPDFEACIKIQSAEYYLHGGQHTDRLSEDVLERLVRLLESKDMDSGGKMTVWQWLVGAWNRNNKTRRIPVTTAMPDYRHMGFPS